MSRHTPTTDSLTPAGEQTVDTGGRGRPDGRRGRSGRQAAAAALVLSAGAAGLLAAGGGAASAAPSQFSAHLTPDNTYFLQLDVSGASTAPGAPVIDWWTTGGANQAWTFIAAGNGNYEIVNQNSGQCLTTDGVAGDQLYQYYCVGAAGQFWKTGLSGDPSDFFAGSSIQNPGSGLAVDVYGDSPWPGAGIDAWYPNGGYNQSFAID